MKNLVEMQHALLQGDTQVVEDKLKFVTASFRAQFGDNYFKTTEEISMQTLYRESAELLGGQQYRSQAQVVGIELRGLNVLAFNGYQRGGRRIYYVDKNAAEAFVSLFYLLEGKYNPEGNPRFTPKTRMVLDAYYLTKELLRDQPSFAAFDHPRPIVAEVISETDEIPVFVRGDLFAQWDDLVPESIHRKKRPAETVHVYKELFKKYHESEDRATDPIFVLQQEELEALDEWDVEKMKLFLHAIRHYDSNGRVGEGVPLGVKQAIGTILLEEHGVELRESESDMTDFTVLELKLGLALCVERMETDSDIKNLPGVYRNSQKKLEEKRLLMQFLR